MNPTFYLVHNQARESAKKAIDYAPEGWVVRIRPPNKTRAQEDTYHRLFDIAAKNCRHLNEILDDETWKRLLVDQFRTDALEDVHCSQVMRDNLAGASRMMPSLDGRRIVALGVQTRDLKKETASALIEWLNAFLAEKGIPE